MRLVINNKIISEPLINILEKLKKDCQYKYLHDIKISGDNIMISCPFHKDGQERHPSCSIFARDDDNETAFGIFKCFTCDEKGPLSKIVAQCLQCSISEAEDWLCENFANIYFEQKEILPEIIVDKNTSNDFFLDEQLLDMYDYYHPYLKTRHISEGIAKYFKIGFNKERNTITFPVWDERGRLLGITERSVDKKEFYIPNHLKKPIYLLNEILKNNLTTAFVVESQIDALNLWEWGYPSIALFGTGCKSQYEILKKSGINKYYLCLDGDEAGKKGCNRFIDNMPSDIFISRVEIPECKDINDLTKDEFIALKINNL